MSNHFAAQYAAEGTESSVEVPEVDQTAFEVTAIDADDALVMCVRCDNGFVVHAETWLTGAGDEINRSTRVCTYCGQESLTVGPA